MHKTFKIKAAVVANLLALSFINPAFSHTSEGKDAEKHCHKQHQTQGKSAHFFGKNHDGLPPFLKNIELSASQKTDILAVIQAEKPSIEAHFQQRRENMKALHQLSNKESFDEKQAETLANQIAQLEKEAFLNRAKVGNKIFTLLTPEQRTKAAENIKKIDEKMEQIKAQPARFDHHSHKKSTWFKS